MKHDGPRSSYSSLIVSVTHTSRILFAGPYTAAAAEKGIFCLAQAAQAKNIPSEEESPGFSVTWDFCFDISNIAPFEVVMNSAGLVNIEAYQAHTEAIERTNSRINSLNSALEYEMEEYTQAGFNSGSIYAEKFGEIMNLTFNFTYAQDVQPDTTITVYILPKKFWPKKSMKVTFVHNGYISPLLFVNNENGAVSFKAISGKYTADTWIYGTLTYML